MDRGAMFDNLYQRDNITAMVDKSSKYQKDINLLKKLLPRLPKTWNGKTSVLELKKADYNWRQMEWWAFYFEYKARAMLQEGFQIPGNRIGNVTFDLRGEINWDLKSKAIKTDNQGIILNDKKAMDASISRDGFHGEIIALCDVEYNDTNRTFQRWHSQLKGGLSAYEAARRKRTAVSRYRKTKAELKEILLLVFTKKDLPSLGIMKQGRNSDGSPRNVKYIVSNLEDLDLSIPIRSIKFR